MLGTENLVRLSDDGHTEIATRSYTEMWEDCFCKNSNILVYAPRRSGKTTALLNEFVKSLEDSIFITHNRAHSDYCYREMREIFGLRVNNSLLHNKFVSLGDWGGYVNLCQEGVKNFIMDEICMFRDEIATRTLTRIRQFVGVNGGRFIAATTPTSRGHEMVFDEVIELPYGRKRLQKVKNHFNRELFEI